MKLRLSHKYSSGYTLLEVLAAAGIISAAIGGAGALSMSITKQEEFTRGQLAAIRFAESLARLWQLGINPSDVILSQPQGASTNAGYNLMTWSIATFSTITLGDDGGISQGSVEKTTVTVTWTPYGVSTSNNFTLDVLRPASAHR
jgi:type II secretory pathway pseudopilin PulG